MNIRKIIIPSLLVSFAIVSCKTTKQTETTVVTPPKKTGIDCGAEIPVYLTDIKPIFEKNCNRCHGSTRQAANLDFTKMTDIKKTVDNGELLGTIKWAEGFSHMPARADKLDDQTIKKIECWIQTGMK